MSVTLKVNLLKSKHTLSERELAREITAFRYAMMGFLGVLAVSGAILIYQFVLTNKLQNLEKAIASANAQLLRYAEASAQQIYLKSRLNLIGGFLGSRSVTREAVQNVFSLDLPGVVVANMSFENEETIGVQFVAQDVLSFEGLIGYLRRESGFFTQSVSEGVVRTKEGGYQVKVKMKIPQNSGTK